MTAAAAMGYVLTENQITTTTITPTPPSSSLIMINSIPIDLDFLDGLVDHPMAHDRHSGTGITTHEIERAAIIGPGCTTGHGRRLVLLASNYEIVSFL